MQSAGDTPPEISSVFEQVQIDHKVIDLIIVDERDRQPISRPYLTIAIDVFSRCIVGMVVTLKPHNDWERLQGWIQNENLSLQDFSDALAVLDGQTE